MQGDINRRHHWKEGALTAGICLIETIALAATASGYCWLLWRQAGSVRHVIVGQDDDQFSLGVLWLTVIILNVIACLKIKSQLWEALKNRSPVPGVDRTLIGLWGELSVTLVVFGMVIFAMLYGPVHDNMPQADNNPPSAEVLASPPSQSVMQAKNAAIKIGTPAIPINNNGAS